MSEIQTTFDAVPNGTTFEWSCRVKDPRDRRRFVYLRRQAIKRGHGTEAGWAIALGDMMSVRFHLKQHVYVKTDDLRLIMAIARGMALADRGANDVHAS